MKMPVLLNFELIFSAKKIAIIYKMHKIKS